MANIFLDTNIFIDIIEQRQPIDFTTFSGHILYISPLSLHILAYVYKYKIPNEELLQLCTYVNIVPFTDEIARNALQGPTGDFEDNVQLHSAAAMKCDVFLTEDESLLTFAFFGTMRLLSRIP